MEPIRVIRDLRPLYFCGRRLYCTRYDRICSTDDYGETFRDEGRLDLVLPYSRLIGASNLAQRVLRANVYRMRMLPNGNRIFVFRGGVYTQEAGQPRAVRTCAVEHGSRPVSLAASRNGIVAFGEYWNNAQRDAVRIFRSSDSGISWEVAHTFEPGAIRHVHGISYDSWEDCFWICTGDCEDESRLIRATTDFRDLQVLRQGGRHTRFYSILVGEHHLLTATDTPSDQNVVCVIEKRSGNIETVAEIDNTSFYGCAVNGYAFVSTNAEPSPLNDVDASHVWAGHIEGGNWRRVLSFPVDHYARLGRLPGLPTGLFQYPRVFFPDGDNPGRVLVCQAIGVRGLHNATLCYDLSEWEV
jgi:hypothetical protein